MFTLRVSSSSSLSSHNLICFTPFSHSCSPREDSSTMERVLYSAKLGLFLERALWESFGSILRLYNWWKPTEQFCLSQILLKTVKLNHNSVPFVSSHYLPRQFFQIVLDVLLLRPISHRQLHQLLVVFLFQLLLDLPNYLFVPSPNHLPLFSLLFPTLFDQVDFIFIPLLQSRHSFHCLFVLPDQILFEVLLFLDLFLFFQFYNKVIAELILK